MRRISTRKISQWERILFMFDRLVTGEVYILTTGKNIGDFESALNAWIVLTEDYLKL